MSLAKEITLVLLLKAVLLYLIWDAWFDHAPTDEQRMSRVERAILKR